MAKNKFEKEASAAAGWWKDNIGGSAKQDNGDAFASMMLLRQ